MRFDTRAHSQWNLCQSAIWAKERESGSASIGIIAFIYNREMFLFDVFQDESRMVIKLCWILCALPKSFAHVFSVFFVSAIQYSFYCSYKRMPMLTHTRMQ